MNMKHIIKFNEAKKSKKEECDFETFKELMLDISDYYKCEFKDISDGDDNNYEFAFGACYLCEISLPDHEPIFGHSNHDAVDINDFNLSELKNKIKIINDNNNKIFSIIEIMKEYVVPRFASFSNFTSCYVFYDTDYSNEIKITFDLLTD